MGEIPRGNQTVPRGINPVRYWMVIVTCTVRVRPPPVPVMVRVVALVGFALGFAFIVSVVPVVELVGLNEPVVLGGKLVRENVTAPLNPLVGLTEIA
jgi:hypothetical protein